MAARRPGVRTPKATSLKAGTVAPILRPHSLRSSSAPPAPFALRAASRDQVRGVGGPDPASQLRAPPADRRYAVVRRVARHVPLA